MSEQTTGTSGGEIVLLGLEQSWWLYQGDAYLSPLISGQGSFPTPIRCLVFENILQLRRYVGSAVSLVEYWGINPDVIERLRSDGHLLEVAAGALPRDGTDDATNMGDI
jgi:hypothetical protein